MTFGFKAAAVAVAMTAALGAAQGAQAAQVIDWTLSGGTFDDGGTFSGTFTYDPSVNSITAWNVTTTDGTAPNAGGVQRTGNAYVTTPIFFFGGAFFIPGTSFYTGFLSGTELDLTNLDPTAPGGPISLTGSEYDYVVNFMSGGFTQTNVRNVTGGSAIGVLTSAGVPEPAEWALMIVGAGLAGATLRAQRKAALA